MTPTTPTPSTPAARPLDPAAFLAFWREAHYATLTTVRRNGTPHVVPVSVTYEPADEADPTAGGTARVVASRGSQKVRNIAARGEEGLRVALCQVDRGRWATLEGVARIREDAPAVRDAERRFAERYSREPRPNPERVLVEITVDRTMGRTPA
ncbi:TIGR03618 family F420-dependent PPOX class oxidoreductase [Streptomyces sp. HNM0574]|uniref:pyridoxamine 5'-phosphate oxidase family protein n=1 Tax=Streptomyces sp. HNM0574 TaxID=2714954 RepID=UPI00146B2444|nr:TIGR03618 family F420-dependent PPOX class oxidoreductase [Streptomyces sp. HNM0574]NLU68592.1 TIGR03618 family F420-dependent PPOX class oxidoreductase [Streptomyces sp. HNM0574]